MPGLVHAAGQEWGLQCFLKAPQAALAEKNPPKGVLRTSFPSAVSVLGEGPKDRTRYLLRERVPPH